MGRFRLAEELADHLGREQVEQRLAVFRQESVEIDQRPDPLADRGGNAGDHHAAIGMAADDHIGQVLILDHVDDIADMRRERDVIVGEMGALADAGMGRRVNVMPGGTQQARDTRVAPSPMPSAVNENKRCHGDSSLCFDDCSMCLLAFGKCTGNASARLLAPPYLPWTGEVDREAVGWG